MSPHRLELQESIKLFADKEVCVYFPKVTQSQHIPSDTTSPHQTRMIETTKAKANNLALVFCFFFISAQYGSLDYIVLWFCFPFGKIIQEEFIYSEKG